MPAKKREGDTGKPTKELKVQCLKVVVESEAGPPTGPTIPDPPATGHFCLCSRDGVIGWEPHE